MPVPALFEKQVKSILKNVADIRNFLTAAEVYSGESQIFLKNTMEKAGVEYNTDIENLRLPFHDEPLSYAFTQLINQLIQYQKSTSYLHTKFTAFDHQTTRQLAAVFDQEESNAMRHKVILNVVEGIEELTEEKQQLIELTKAIEATIRQLEIRLRVFFN